MTDLLSSFLFVLAYALTPAMKRLQRRHGSSDGSLHAVGLGGFAPYRREGIQLLLKRLGLELHPPVEHRVILRRDGDGRRQCGLPALRRLR
jgi:hypothetical protein